MRRLYLSVWLAALVAMVGLVSCDTMSSVEYRIHNASSDTVTVTFDRVMMSSPYQGYYLEENDSVTTHYSDDSCNVARLAPNRQLTVRREWSGLYREELLVHAWRYISSIKVGDVKVDSTTWNNEAAWHHRTVGGGRFAKEESHFYDLWLKGK